VRELVLLNHIYLANAQLDAATVVIPPGDDMGCVRIGSQEVLVTVDQIVDGVHFNLAATRLEKIARKAITRNLSDVAAMAAIPVAAVAAALLPRDLGQDRAEALFDAMRATANDYRCPLIGGDIGIYAGPLVLTVTIIARPGPVAPARRSGATPGQGIFVTGVLGGSLLTYQGHTHHLDFEPRLAVALRLAELLGETGIFRGAMIDLSDGLATDLGHICTASNVTAELWPHCLPISPALAGDRLPGAPGAWQHALTDGEDYELCFTAAVEAMEGLTSLEGVPVTHVGTILPPRSGPTISLKWPDGRVEPLTARGWEHHSS
jgi:thiamine-monophosphate kinase